jgi:NAD(P)-dependent dehydrogenase (short-subunit alcohol dehydrogenase family)
VLTTIPISSMLTKQYRSQIEVHNLGGFFFLRSALQTTLEQNLRKMTGARYSSRGTIVLLTSLASEGAFKGVGNYTAAKFAVKGLIQTTSIY